MIGRIVGGVLGAAINREGHRDPVKGAAIGAATMFLARRFLPARLAMIGATVAAAYVAKKMNDHEDRRAAGASTAAPATPAPTSTTTRARRTAAAPATPRRARAARTPKSPPANP